MKLVINLIDGRKAEFNVSNVEIDRTAKCITITEVEVPAKVGTLAAAVKAAVADENIRSIAKLLKIGEQEFSGILNTLEMHAESGTAPARKYRRENFSDNVIMTLFAVKGFTCVSAKKWLKKHGFALQINNDHYSRLINGDKGWECVKELLNIHVEQRVIDRAAVKAALESGLSYKEVQRRFGIGLALLYEIKNGRKYTPRL